MVRVKRGVMAHKRRKNILKYTKGYRWGRKSKFRAAKDALLHAGNYAFRDRRAKKREFRRLWQIQISAACKKYHLPYNKFIFHLKKNKIELNRKALSELSQKYPEVFEKIVETCVSK
jgi:large subunit ribosomal protein L20